ncbi:PREDICTED: granzyme H-like [Elephantulus edwardii]|uniref:granzyme H-like n=1 Tax=Elephantulus edwardii TaxID=28737 RepID=UPI0003F06264|nr:PREDICTED: granzyme H-like [Elephantulus edwardii]
MELMKAEVGASGKDQRGTSLDVLGRQWRLIAEEIIGGHVARRHSRPYMAFVELFHDGKKKTCGGFLVEEDIVMTAAHCLGRISENEQTSKLHEVDLTIQGHFQCECRFRNYYRTSQLCVGDPQKMMSSFKGDSGGPLVCNNVAQAIVSSGSEKGAPPSIFIKISSFLPWIKKTIKGLHLEESP